MTTDDIDPDPDQRAISDAYPGWTTWGGAIAGLVYAKRDRPQIVVRSTSDEGLRAEIERAERDRRLR